MKRIICILLLGLGLVYVDVKYNGLQQKYKIQTEEFAKLKNKDQQNSVVIAEEQPKDSGETADKNKEKELVETFVDSYTNFDSIDSRNESIIDFVTKECKTENALDVEVHADFDSEGTIDAIYQKNTDPSAYLVLGKENSRGASHEFLMELHISNDKVDQYSYKYIAQN